MAKKKNKIVLTPAQKAVYDRLWPAAAGKAEWLARFRFRRAAGRDRKGFHGLAATALFDVVAKNILPDGTDKERGRAFQRLEGLVRTAVEFDVLDFVKKETTDKNRDLRMEGAEINAAGTWSRSRSDDRVSLAVLKGDAEGPQIDEEDWGLLEKGNLNVYVAMRMKAAGYSPEEIKNTVHAGNVRDVYRLLDTGYALVRGYHKKGAPHARYFQPRGRSGAGRPVGRVFEPAIGTGTGRPGGREGRQNSPSCPGHLRQLPAVTPAPRLPLAELNRRLEPLRRESPPSAERPFPFDLWELSPKKGH
jgi:hypothetical protein